MTLKQRTEAFARVGDFIRDHYTRRSGTEEALHKGLDQVIALAHLHNNWFIPKFVNHAIAGIGSYLERAELEKFAAPLHVAGGKTVAIVCAGNIPMVGWHDIMCVLLAGHKALVKLSSDDNVLLPFFLKLLTQYEPALEQQVLFASGRLSAFDAVIATGSNNTAGHFRHYFSRYPHIIRHNRTSLAVLTGRETAAALAALGNDIFMYFGLGCRNVGKLLVPTGYSFNHFFENMLAYSDVVNNKKYGNNYDYHRAIYLLEQQKFLDNNFVMVKESADLHAPVGVIYYQAYTDGAEVQRYLTSQEAELQCVVGEGFVPFGYSQQPVITDFADNVNTLAFLVNL